jgi:hypothetical protein
MRRTYPPCASGCALIVAAHAGAVLLARRWAVREPVALLS